jgi:heptosyltransferase-1
MSLTLKQKRALLRVAEPPLWLVYLLFRLASREQFADRRLPGLGGADPERILVVRLDNIGDVLLSEPAIRALQERFPHADIDVIAGKGGRAILASHPAIRSFIAYDAPWHAAWRGGSVDWRGELPALLRAMKEMRRNKYDLAVELRGDFRDIALMSGSGARVKVGSSWRGGHRFLDYDFPAHLDGHRIDLALGIVSALGAGTTDRVPRMHIQPEHRAKADSLLPDTGSLIVFHLGSGFANDRLPVEKFAAVAKALISEGKGGDRRLVLVGGTDDREIANRFIQQLAFQPIDLVGRLTLLETSAVLERSRLFIGGDSGPMHMASALGVPTVTFFGSEFSTNYGPVGSAARILEIDMPCRPCDHVHCVHGVNLCLTSIVNEDIVRAAEELLDESEAKESSPAASTGSRKVG